MATPNSTRAAKEGLRLTKQEEKLLRLFKRIPSKVERQAFIVLGEAIAFGRLTK